MRLISRIALGLCILLMAGASDGAAADWLDSEWGCRIEFSARSELIAGSMHMNFTFLLKLDGANHAAVFEDALPDGSDLVITASDGQTILGHEIVSYDPIAQEAEIWFRMMTVVPDVTTTFYLYYGNPLAISAPTPGAAWTDEHLAVYHFSEDPSEGVLLDWGPSGDDAFTGAVPDSCANCWETSDLVAGPIGGAWDFNGTTQWVYSPSISSQDSSFTISAWFANSPFVDRGAVAFQSLSGFWDLAFQRTQGEHFAEFSRPGPSMSWLPAILDSLPHHYAWTLNANADTARFYLDGVEQAVRTTFQPPVYTAEVIKDRVGIAGPAYYNSLDVSDGIVDEFHIVEGVRDPDWVLTEYNNQSDPIGFFEFQPDSCLSTAVGPDSFAGGPGLGRITIWPNPFQGTTEINVESDDSTVAVRVYDVAGRLVRNLRRPASGSSRLLRLSWDGRDEHGTSVSSGIYYVRAESKRGSIGAKALLMR